MFKHSLFTLCLFINLYWICATATENTLSPFIINRKVDEYVKYGHKFVMFSLTRVDYEQQVAKVNDYLDRAREKSELVLESIEEYCDDDDKTCTDFAFKDVEGNTGYFNVFLVETISSSTQSAMKDCANLPMPSTNDELNQLETLMKDKGVVKQPLMTSQAVHNSS
jgi:hypothetical protein